VHLVGLSDVVAIDICVCKNDFVDSRLESIKTVVVVVVVVAVVVFVVVVCNRTHN
jgi:hypothetical protein